MASSAIFDVHVPTSVNITEKIASTSNTENMASAAVSDASTYMNISENMASTAVFDVSTSVNITENIASGDIFDTPNPVNITGNMASTAIFDVSTSVNITEDIASTAIHILETSNPVNITESMASTAIFDVSTSANVSEGMTTTAIFDIHVRTSNNISEDSEGMTATDIFETTTTVFGTTMDAGTLNEPLTDYPEYEYGNDSTTDDMFSYHEYEKNDYIYPGEEEYDYPMYSGEEYDDFIYPGYSFERPVYMYIWGILVIITFLANIIVISVLLRKQMRNPTNMILAAIAISDSLTGLVTLPTYWMVYSKLLLSEMDNDHYGNLNATSLPRGVEAITEPVQQIFYTSDQNFEYDYSMYPENKGNEDIRDGYELSQNLCRGFMISKYFLSKTFHTISIWLTLLLGFQRFILVALPFRAKTIFSERNVVVTCFVIAVLAPVLHVYHLVNDKADSTAGMCQWDIEEEFAGGVAYLVTAFLFRHFFPCVLLVVFTILFISRLAKSSRRLSRVDSNRSSAATQHRDNENRRMSLTVLLIVIVFLIPEVPYGVFLLYALIGKIQQVQFNLETNRAVHLAYEISLVLSFHANIYIYTFFNKKFRKALVRDIVYPILTCCDMFSCFGLSSLRDTWSRMSFSSGSGRGTRQSTTAATRIEMGSIHRSSSSAGRSTTITVH